MRVRINLLFDALFKNKGKYLVFAIIFIIMFLGTIIISCCIVNELTVEKLWSIAANVTIFFGGIGIIYSLFQIYFDNKTVTKEMALLEIDLCNELDSLIIFDEIFLKQETTLNLKDSMQYINKIDILSQKELISIDELSIFSGNKLKTLLIIVIKHAYDLLSNKDENTYILILKYKDSIINVFNNLLKKDKDLNLLNEKVKYIKNAKPKNYIASNIIAKKQTE